MLQGLVAMGFVFGLGLVIAAVAVVGVIVWLLKGPPSRTAPRRRA